MSVTFDTSDFDATCDALINQANSGYENDQLAAAGKEMVDLYAREMMERFISYSHGGGMWEPLSPNTEAKRAAFTNPDPETVRQSAHAAAAGRNVKVQDMEFPILYVTGALYNSLAPGDSSNEFVLEGDTITYGTRIPYAVPLHYGDPTNTWYGHPAPIPARPILVTPGPDVVQVAAQSHARAVAAVASS